MNGYTIGAALIALVTAILGLVAAFGVAVTDAERAAIITATSALITLIGAVWVNTHGGVQQAKIDAGTAVVTPTPSGGSVTNLTGTPVPPGS